MKNSRKSIVGSNGAQDICRISRLGMIHLFFLFLLVWGVPALSRGGLSVEIAGAGLNGLPAEAVEVTTLFNKDTTEAFGNMLDAIKQSKE